MDLIELCEKEPSLEKLMDFFNNQNLSDYVVVYLRLLTSGYLQREHGFFQHFIEGGAPSRSSASRWVPVTRGGGVVLSVFTAFTPIFPMIACNL